jgi:hypothetical protein
VAISRSFVLLNPTSAGPALGQHGDAVRRAPEDFGKEFAAVVEATDEPERVSRLMAECFRA